MADKDALLEKLELKVKEFKAEFIKLKAIGSKYEEWYERYKEQHK